MNLGEGFKTLPEAQQTQDRPTKLLSSLARVTSIKYQQGVPVSQWLSDIRSPDPDRYTWGPMVPGSLEYFFTIGWRQLLAFLQSLHIELFRNSSKLLWTGSESAWTVALIWQRVKWQPLVGVFYSLQLRGASQLHVDSIVAHIQQPFTHQMLKWWGNGRPENVFSNKDDLYLNVAFCICGLMCNPTQSGGRQRVYLSGGRQYGVFASFEAIRQLGSSGLGASPTPYPRTWQGSQTSPPSLPCMHHINSSLGMDENTKARGTEIVPDDLSEPPPSSKPLSLVADSCFVDLSPCRFGLVQQEIYYILLTKTKTKTVIQTKGSHPSP